MRKTAARALLPSKPEKSGWNTWLGLGTGHIAVETASGVLTLGEKATGEFVNRIANGGTVNVSGSSLILSGDISGTGRVNVLSGADVLLSGDNSRI